jgi:serine/threonine protein kinase
LLSHIRVHGGLPEDECKRLFFQLYGLIRYLHLHRFIVHRDLKLENCLLDANNNLKLIDFGLCSTTYCNAMRTRVGTPGYIAPEVLVGVEYSEKCDVFSLGVCLYIMRKASLPFRAQSNDSLLLVAQIQELKFGVEFSNELTDLIRRMVEPRQSERIELLEIARHPWMSGFVCPSGTIVPKPIVFFKINDMSDVLKFRRKFVKIDEDILSRACEFLGLADRQKLADALRDGLITEETTVYYLMLRPCPEEPHIPRPPDPALAAPSTKSKRSNANDQKGRRRPTKTPGNSTPRIRRPEASPRFGRLRAYL